MDTTERYQGGEWTRGPDLPYRLGYHCQAALAETVYITGGKMWDSAGTIATTAATLRLADSGWEAAGEMGEARLGHACAEFEGRLWVVGGAASLEGELLSSVEVNTVQVLRSG